jgi:DNA-binding CsgD family transcriptional regulator
MMCGGATAEEIGGIAERTARQADVLLEEGATALVITGTVLGLVWSDRLDAAELLLDRAVDIARRRGSTTDFALVLTRRASVHNRAGRLREAEADARSALAAGGGPGWAGGGSGSVIPLLASLIGQGRTDEAEHELAAAQGDGEVPDAPAMTPLLVERMRLRAAQADYGRALADWEEAVRRAERLFGLSPAWIGDLATAAEVHRALGDMDAASALVDRAVAFARRWGTPGSIGQALHASARLGAAEDAEGTLRDAVEHLRRSPARLELARALITLGEVLRRRGRRVDSREPLREGYELARACGAAALAETARAELRASGVRLRREALTGADSLTASERRIAELAAGGTSNAEIAQALFLTVKTVEMHLTHSYRKLDISGRSALAKALPDKS